MNRILLKKNIAKDTFKFTIENKDVACAWKPGQFAVFRIHQMGERIPLTIVRTDCKKATFDIIFQVAGKTTLMFSELEEGGDILDVAGPLGTASDIKNYGKCIIVAGGVGAAVAYPVLKALKNEGCKITCLVGAKSELFLILTDQIKQLSDQLIITTDDDTKGKKGFVTDALENLLNKDSNFDYVYTAGPLVMMEKVAQITKKYSIKTVASLNNIMVDATGMCGGCRTLVAGQEKLACVDGPEFNAHQVDFKLLKQRKQMFKEQEEQAFKSYREQKQRK